MTTFTKPRREVHSVYLHCSASDRPEHDDVAVIRRWHLARGFADVGYHYFITKAGQIQPGRSIERQPAGQAGHNRGTIAICLHGLAVEHFTVDQFDALRALCVQISRAYGRIRFRGHREVAAKACPVFDYAAVLGLDADGYRTGTALNPPAQPETPATYEPQTLRILDRGPDVAVLQRTLNANGAFLDPDGIFGQATREAVLAFQRANALDPDGIAGPLTLGALHRATGKEAA